MLSSHETSTSNSYASWLLQNIYPLCPEIFLSGGYMLLTDTCNHQSVVRAVTILKEADHPSHKKGSLQPFFTSGKRLKSIRRRTSRLLKSFSPPRAVRALNSDSAALCTLAIITNEGGLFEFYLLIILCLICSFKHIF